MLYKITTAGQKLFSMNIEVILRMFFACKHENSKSKDTTRTFLLYITKNNPGLTPKGLVASLEPSFFPFLLPTVQSTGLRVSFVKG